MRFYYLFLRNRKQKKKPLKETKKDQLVRRMLCKPCEEGAFMASTIQNAADASSKISTIN